MPRYAETNDLRMASLAGDRNQQLTNDNAGYMGVRWAADETRIAYVSAEGTDRFLDRDWIAPWTLYTQDVRTGRRRALLREKPSVWSAQGRQAAWLPHRHLLVYVPNNHDGVYLIDSDNGRRVLLASAVPDGFDLAAGKMYRLDQSDTSLRVYELPRTTNGLATPRAWQSTRVLGVYVLPIYPEAVAFSPDGRYLALSLAVFGSAMFQPRQLVVVDITSRLAVPLGIVKRQPNQIGWSRDSAHLLVVLKNAAGRPESIVAISATDGSPQPLARVAWQKRDPVPFETLVRLPPNVERVAWVEAP